MAVRGLRSLLGAACLWCSVSWLHDGVAALDAVTTLEEVAAIESSSKVYALLVLATPAPTEDANNADEEEDPHQFVEMATTAYPALHNLEEELDGLASFAIVDIAPHRKGSLATKWNLPSLPALVIYTDPPKENPYTGKQYRDAVVADVGLLERPRKLKRTLKEGIPTEFVQELSGTDVSLESVGKFVDEHTQQAGGGAGGVVLLLSKQQHASHLFHALSAEFHDQGLTFAFMNKDEPGVGEVMDALQISDVPALLVLQSMTEHVALESGSMKTYKELKGFVEPFVIQQEGHSADSKTKRSKKDSKVSSFVRFFSESDFKEEVLASDVAWIIEFMDAEQEAAASEEAWKKTFKELQRKSGMIALGAVSCEREAELCERYGGPGVRVFPLELLGLRGLKRGDTLPQSFATIDEATEATMESLPDASVTVESSMELNGFVSQALETHALPVLLFTAKSSTPPMMKSLALSFPTQKLKLAVIHDADAGLKGQFQLKPSTKTALVCLVPTEPSTEHPIGAAPFGIITYDKLTMGPYTYPNIMQFMMQVLSQYPHPVGDGPKENDAVDYSSLDDASAHSLVPYLTKDNLEELCGANKICAIGFFEDHVDTLDMPDSRLSKSWATLAHVAALSKQNGEPFHFMWVNGKCQKNFAEAFDVGLYQMPTVAVFSPSKQRYATNVGMFDEENASGFLKSVLSGKIGTAPMGNVPDLVEDCPFEDIQVVAEAVDSDDGDDVDLDDMLSEILVDEKKQRELLEEELRSEHKDEKKGKKSKKSKKSKKGKKKKKKAERDEL